MSNDSIMTQVSQTQPVQTPQTTEPPLVAPPELAPPPAVIKPIKPSYRELHKYWFGYELPPKQPRRFSASRMIKLYKSVYNLDVVRIEGYKAFRHSPVLYNVYTDTGELLLDRVPLPALYLGIEDEYDNPDY